MGACCRTLQATQDYDAQPDTKAVAWLRALKIGALRAGGRLLSREARRFGVRQRDRWRKLDDSLRK